LRNKDLGVDAERLEANLAAVRRRLGEACARVGRNPAEVTLVAVSKSIPPGLVAVLASAGQIDFGENRVQEAIAKIPACPAGLRWHLIGHLQKNKAGKAAGCFERMHSLDGYELAEVLERALAKTGKPLPCLLEVNVSGEESKHGVSPAEAPALVSTLRALHGVRLDGLMTLAPLDPDPERARPWFRALRELRDRINDAAPPERRLVHLSMGMSQDFEVAVEEGATFVRVGSALFRGNEG
jgi:pyridoxal phosphate enzyme (YggS family)